ncbi:hypothetical protein [Bradyrhizobium liaoningense]|uniref:hypothetical protein n=1 Tax=Bradyrhizobium liaoningense TaxID=43992 RepID=UPI0024E1738E|nr:hypothetical protein [Bradyrhizobium liaoningense]
MRSKNPRRCQAENPLKLLSEFAGPALVHSRRAKPGVNAADFDKALTVARERFPQAPTPDPFVAQLKALGVIEAPVVNPVVPAMQLRAEGRLARFLPQWRIRR